MGFGLKTKEADACLTSCCASQNKELLYSVEFQAGTKSQRSTSLRKLP